MKNMIEPNGPFGACDCGRGDDVKARWNPYLVGIGIGVLSWIAFGVVNQPLGISTALSSASRKSGVRSGVSSYY